MCDNMIIQDDFSSDKHPNFFTTASIDLQAIWHICDFCFCGMRFSHSSRIWDDLLELYASALWKYQYVGSIKFYKLDRLSKVQ